MDNTTEPAAKIALFRSLFRGREDVYAVRFENRKTGRSGYSPACANEWVRGLCEKPKIKCAMCPNRRWLPVTDEVIRWHLTGKDNHNRDFVMGAYPMLKDETCFFLAVDFDGENWQSDAAAVQDICRERMLPAALERSRSGKGGHLWLFFAAAISARTARNMGSCLLTEAMERRPEVGLDSYDRLFPNQDTLPKGGFGNLIALPLQKAARAHDHSIFLDEQFQPYSDQWSYLASVQRITRQQCESIAREAESQGRITGVRPVLELDAEDEAPWLAPPRRRKEPPIAGALPESLEVVLSDQIYIPKAALPPALINRLARLAAFQNPEFYRAQSMRLPVFNKPRIIHCAEDHAEFIGLPRGCMDEAIALLEGLKIKALMRDKRQTGQPITVTFQGELRTEQVAAAHSMLAHETGVLAATTAFGKTVLAAWLIAQRGVNTLILVHRQQLLEQWVERLASFLRLPPKAVGRIGGGRKEVTGFIDVALMQSLGRKGEVKDLVADYGHVVVDECHHLSAHSFELIARRAKARYFTGLSATVTRKDGHHPLIFMQCGPVRHRVNARQQAAARPFSHLVMVRPTNFRMLEPPAEDSRQEFQALYHSLANDAVRNQLITQDVIKSVAEGRNPLVLTERIEHLELLAALIRPHIPHVIVLHGGMGKKELRDTLAQTDGQPANPPGVVLATGKFIGEGFDCSRLDTLFLALPVSWRGTIAQYVGRLHRLHEGKREVRVYDYADLNVSMLARMFDRRCAGYEAVGYTIQLPGSAVPGWPAEVPLPIEPEWKRDYAASVRRLVVDGVDVQLANLFVHAAAKFSPNAQGSARARSASEAFLFRRLETLPETNKRFRLNEKLPIAFDGHGEMEVDLLDADARLVIEVDGPHHLADFEAYRRDRRKDALLQEHGYRVLRFLAEDVGKNFDQILDTVLRFVAQHGRK